MQKQVQMMETGPSGCSLLIPDTVSQFNNMGF